MVSIIINLTFRLHENRYTRSLNNGVKSSELPSVLPIQKFSMLLKNFATKNAIILSNLEIEPWTMLSAATRATRPMRPSVSS